MGIKDKIKNHLRDTEEYYFYPRKFKGRILGKALLKSTPLIAASIAADQIYKRAVPEKYRWKKDKSNKASKLRKALDAGMDNPFTLGSVLGIGTGAAAYGLPLLTKKYNSVPSRMRNAVKRYKKGLLAAQSLDYKKKAREVEKAARKLLKDKRFEI